MTHRDYFGGDFHQGAGDDETPPEFDPEGEAGGAFFGAVFGIVLIAIGLNLVVSAMIRGPRADTTVAIGELGVGMVVTLLGAVFAMAFIVVAEDRARAAREKRGSALFAVRDD